MLAEYRRQTPGPPGSPGKWRDGPRHPCWRPRSRWVGSRTDKVAVALRDGSSNTPGAPKPSPARRNWTGSTSCAERTATADVVRSYKNLTNVERAFRSLKTVDLADPRPGRDAGAVALLCLLAYYVQWHLRRALAPLLFRSTGPESRAASAKRKKTKRKTEDGLRFFKNMAEMAARHQCRFARSDAATIDGTDSATGAGVGHGVPSGQLGRFVVVPLESRSYLVSGLELRIRGAGGTESPLYTFRPRNCMAVQKSRRQESRLSRWATRKSPLPMGDKKVAPPRWRPPCRWRPTRSRPEAPSAPRPLPRCSCRSRDSARCSR